MAAGVFAVVATAASAEISRREVMDAIGLLERDVTSEGAPDAAAVVMQFGEESDSVLVTIGPETMPWLEGANVDPSTSETERALLTAAYVAGNIKAQLQRHVALDDPYAGWQFALRAYRQLCGKNKNFNLPSLDRLARLEKEGKLKQLAEDLTRQERERNRKANTF